MWAGGTTSPPSTSPDAMFFYTTTPLTICCASVASILIDPRLPWSSRTTATASNDSIWALPLSYPAVRRVRNRTCISLVIVFLVSSYLTVIGGGTRNRTSNPASRLLRWRFYRPLTANSPVVLHTTQLISLCQYWSGR